MAIDREDLLAAALEYAALGYAVFPCVPGAKHPLTSSGFKDATNDPAVIEEWWVRHPDANIGLSTDGLLVVDIDGEQNPWPASDERLLDLGKCPIARTPGGGFHHFFRQPEGKAYRNTAGRLAPRVDTRATGGYVLLAPSVVGGKPYSWQPACELSEPPCQLPLAPDWLCEAMDTLEEVRGAPGEDGNPIPERQRNVTLARLAGAMRRVGMTQGEILAATLQVNADRCKPPLDQAEVERIACSISRYAPDQTSVAIAEDHYGQDFETAPSAVFRDALGLCQEYKAMNPPVIHGLLREGETMNVIAAPKTGKSWLVLNLALSVAAGKPWLDFPTEPGRVLLIDNELHPQTLANRIPRVAEAMQLPEEAWKDNFFVHPLRGRLQDLFRMESYFRELPAGHFKLIILDAFYRFMPKDMDENDNGTMANLYNLLDRCAASLRCAFLLIHHTTKGVQSGKSVTDVGAGAGSQSRAADCHFVLRPHEADGCLAVEAVTRSWPSPPPVVIRQEFPLWLPDPSLDPAALKKPDHYHRHKSFGAAGDSPVEAEPEEPWTPQRVVEAFVAEAPKLRAAIVAEANAKDLTDNKATRLIEKAEALGLIFRWPGRAAMYATVPAPQLDLEGATESGTKRARVMAQIQENPSLNGAQIAHRCNVSRQYANRVLKMARKNGTKMETCP